MFQAESAEASIPHLPTFIWAFLGAVLIILLLMIAVPLRVITRKPRIERLRAAPPRRVLLWWLAAIVPWAVSIAVVELQRSFHIGTDSLWGAAGYLLLFLALFAVLVVLPVVVIVGTGIWAVGRYKP